MAPPDGADDLSFRAPGQKTDRSVPRSGPLLMLPAAAWRVTGPDLPPAANRGGLRRLDHLVRAALLIWVLPFGIVLTSLADHRIDTDLSGIPASIARAL